MGLKACPEKSNEATLGHPYLAGKETHPFQKAREPVQRISGGWRGEESGTTSTHTHMHSHTHTHTPAWETQDTDLGRENMHSKPSCGWGEDSGTWGRKAAAGALASGLLGEAPQSCCTLSPLQALTVPAVLELTIICGGNGGHGDLKNEEAAEENSV